LRLTNTPSDARLRAGLALLSRSLDDQSRPQDAVEVLKWTFETTARSEHSGQSVGPRLEWFAFLVNHEMCDPAPKQLQAECIHIYQAAHNLSAEDLASASHRYWPH
jgi:hypothetical protein